MAETADPVEVEEPQVLEEGEIAEATEKVAAIDLSNPPKRVPKPDKAELDAKISDIDAAIKKLEEKRLKIKSQLDAKQASRQGIQGQMQAAREEFNRLRNEFNRLKEERAKIFAERDAIKNAINKISAGAKGMRTEVKFHSLAEIEDEIRRLEHKQNTESMSINQEKQLLKEIDALKQSKKVVSVLAAQQEEIKAEKDKSRDINTRIDEKNKQLDEVNAQISAQRKVLDEISANQAPKEETPKLIQERDGVKKEIDAKYNEKRQLKAEFKKAMDEHYQYLRALRAYKNELRRVEYEKRSAEREARLKAIEAEEAKKVPYEDEMALCDFLVNYLQSTFLGTSAAAEGAEEAKTKQPKTHENVAQELEGGWQVLKREEEDFMVMGGAKSKKGKKKKGGKKEEKAGAIVHSLDTIESFSLLGLTPPATRSGVENSIQELKAKKEHYKTLPRPEKKPAAENAPAEATAGAASPKKGGKKSKKEFRADDGDFPTLAGFSGTRAPAIGVYARNGAVGSPKAAAAPEVVENLEEEEA